MRFLTAILIVLSAFAQAPTESAKPAPAPADQGAAASPASPDQGAAASPAPPAEESFTGSIELGYLWRTGVGGSLAAYRSIVNLNQGPRLIGLDFSIVDPNKRYFDRVDVRAYDWGNEPYNSAYLSARKLGVYDLRVSYRNIAYFNALPSFANPNLPGGFDEQSFDMRSRIADAQLDFLPGKRFVPYLAYGTNSWSGSGIATFVQGATNEYPVPENLRNRLDNYRGGLRIDLSKWHIILEEGRTHYKEDDQLYENQFNPGNRSTPLGNQNLFLTNLQEAYGITGRANYSKAMVTATPKTWLTMYGTFLYSQPEREVSYNNLASGNFVLLSSLLFYNGQTALGVGNAEAPHNTELFGLEVRPIRRLRVYDSVTLDHYHDAGFGLLAEQFLLSGSLAASGLSSQVTREVVNYNQQEVDAIYDLTSRLTVRGGYRYVWGDAVVRAGQLSQTGPFDTGQLQRNVALAGISYRINQKLAVNADYEGAATNRAYFRTSLYDYNRLRTRARYQVGPTLSIQANINLLDNQNPASDIRYDFRARDNALAVTWTPNEGKRISLMAEYDRSTIRSNIRYLGLFLAPDISDYRVNSHTATAALDLALPGYRGMTPRLTAGGSLYISSGSRPTSFYQPLVRFSLPVQKHVYWNTEWRWYGYGEEFYVFEGFRVHIFQTGLRFSR
jgi:hypothetical protein